MNNLAQRDDRMNTEVSVWMEEVKAELAAIARRESELKQTRTRFEGTLRWLNSLMHDEE